MTQLLSHLDSTIDKMRRAIEAGDVAGVRAILQGGYAPNSLIRDRYTALHLATTTSAAMDIVPVLLEAGFDVNAYDTHGQTPLQWVLERNPQPELFDLLVAAGANISVRNNQETPLLSLAAQRGHADICRALMAAGADVQTADVMPYTALHYAAMNGHIEVCRMLVAAGASSSWMPEYPEDTYLTPFQSVVRYWEPDAVAFFVRECGESLGQTTVVGRSMESLLMSTGKKEAKLALFHSLAAEKEAEVRAGKSAALGSR